MDIDPDDPVLTTRAVAQLLGVAVSTAQQWIESGRMASWKTPGGHRRVRRSAAMALMRQADANALGNAGEGDFHLPDKPAFPCSPQEIGRLKALETTGLIGSAPERVFDRLTWLASWAAGTPMAMVSLVTAHRQWFKSRIGIDAPETPREWAFCGHAILGSAPLVVNDATADRRFANNPLVTGAPHIRFYAGFPLIEKHGYRIGTLCVLDRKPRILEEEQRRVLQELAAMASEEIGRRA